MNKCDFCRFSKLIKGKLVCSRSIPSLWCEEAIEKMMRYAELTAKANNTKTGKQG